MNDFVLFYDLAPSFKLQANFFFRNKIIENHCPILFFWGGGWQNVGLLCVVSASIDKIYRILRRKGGGQNLRKLSFKYCIYQPKSKYGAEHKSKKQTNKRKKPTKSNIIPVDLLNAEQIMKYFMGAFSVLYNSNNMAKAVANICITKSFYEL